MGLILGVIVLFGAVIGGYLLSHGRLLALWQPNELIILCGASLGALIIGNPLKIVVAALKGPLSVLSGSKYTKSFHMDLFKLMYDVGTKIRKSGLMSLEADLDEPEASELFKNFPKLLHDHHFMHFFCDNLRIIVAGNLNVHDFEALLDQELATHEEEAEKAAAALNRVSDALPGFGIVAAVMGIVITMGLLGGDPKLLGEHVGAALVGTFLGILLSYGLFGPLSNAMVEQAKLEIKFYECIKIFLLSVTTGVPPQLAVEYARRVLYADVKPTFNELEEHVKKKA